MKKRARQTQSRDDKLLAEALEHSAECIKGVWEDGSIPGRLEVWRLGPQQRLWIAAEAIFSWQAKRREQAMRENGNTEEWLKTFVEPSHDLLPEEEAVVAIILPMLREFVVGHGLAGKAVGEWHRSDVAAMIVRIGRAWEQADAAMVEAENETPPWDDIPIEAGKLLGDG